MTPDICYQILLFFNYCISNYIYPTDFSRYYKACYWYRVNNNEKCQVFYNGVGNIDYHQKI